MHGRLESVIRNCSVFVLNRTRECSEHRECSNQCSWSPGRSSEKGIPSTRLSGRLFFASENRVHSEMPHFGQIHAAFWLLKNQQKSTEILSKILNGRKNYKQKWRWTFMKRCILLWTLPETAIAEPFALFCIIIFSAVGRTFVLGTVATFELFTEVEIGLNLLWRYLESVLCRLVWFWSRLILLCSFSLFSRDVLPLFYAKIQLNRG